MARQIKKATAIKNATKVIRARPRLTAAEINGLTSQFDAKKWDATADADRAAEKVARAPRKRAAYA